MNSRNSLQLEGLFQIVQYNENYDCAMISGYITGEEVSRKKQQQRHARLLAKLRSYRFIVISLKGGWENDEGVLEKEQSFFVINRGSQKKSQPEDIVPLERFTEIIVDLGKKYEQEVVVIVPHGALSGRSKAHFIYPETNKKNHMGKVRLGRITGRMYSRVKDKGRPFEFGEATKNDIEILSVHYPAWGLAGQYSCRAISNMRLDKVPIDTLNGTSLREWLVKHRGNV